MNERFRKFAQVIATAAGSPWAFLLAVTAVFIWAISGPLFGFAETWQLVINTGTTIVTFLMIFLVQNAQNRDAKAIHLKLDELIRAQQRANNKLMGSEEHPDEKLEKERQEVEKQKIRTRKKRKKK